MAHLTFENGILKVSFSENEGLDRGEMGILFRMSLPSRPSSEKSVYVFTDVFNLELLATEIYIALERAQIKCTFDENVSKILASYAVATAEFESALKSGNAIRSNDKAKFVPGCTFVRRLKPFQLKPANHLYNLKNAANFSVPGSGKTSVVYAVYSRLIDEKNIDTLVVIGLRNSFMSWEDEFVACFGRKPKVLRIIGSKARRKTLYRLAHQYEIILLTYQAMSRDLSDLKALFHSLRIFLILDESHYIKRLFGGLWADSVLKLAPLASRRAILTGTPMPNGLDDLWSQFEFLWPDKEVLGTRDYFHNFGKAEYDKVKNRIYPLYTRVTKSQLDLPTPTSKSIRILMSPYQMKIYATIKHRIRNELRLAPNEKAELRAWRRARIIRLLQIASNPTLLSKYSIEFDVPPLSGEDKSISEIIRKYPKFEVPSKVKILDKLINKFVRQNGYKVIIWTNFIHNIEMFSKRYSDLYPLPIYGEIARDSSENCEENREKYLKLFKLEKTFNLLIANPSTCAESVSLHKVCRHSIYYDRTFNCGQFLQSMDRIHRVGLKKSDRVFFYFLLSSGSIDSVIHERLIQKAKIMQTILNDDLPLFSYQPDELSLGDVEDSQDLEAVLKHLEDQ